MAKGLKMYGAKTCSQCAQARPYLASKGIEYEEIDIDDVPGAVEEVKRLTGGVRLTPVFVINGEVIIGFKLEKLEAALASLAA
ncbi:MAG: glutaredoxin family protein [Dehalococcoidia bacterium]